MEWNIENHTTSVIRSSFILDKPSFPWSWTEPHTQICIKIFSSAFTHTSTVLVGFYLYSFEKSITFASSCALPWPKNFSTIASANSIAVPELRLVIRLPSTITLFSISLWSDSLLHTKGKAVAFLPWVRADYISQLQKLTIWNLKLNFGN